MHFFDRRSDRPWQQLKVISSLASLLYSSLVLGGRFCREGVGSRETTPDLISSICSFKSQRWGESRKCSELYEPLLLMCLHLPERTVLSPGSITDPLKDLVHHVWIWLSLLSGCSLTNSQHHIAERNLQTHSPIHHSPPVPTAWTTGCHYILIIPRRKIESLHRRKLLEAGMDVGLSIFIRLISVYCRNKYAEKIWRRSGAATPADLWAIIGPGKCVCVHIMRYTICCKYPVWEFTQNVRCPNTFFWT